VPDARHHHAQRDVVLIAVPVPFEGGSPKEAKRLKPGRYPSERREAWRPQQAIPVKRGKAEALKRLLDFMRDNDQAARDFMAQARASAV
jgi:hypothetical protein